MAAPRETIYAAQPLTTAAGRVIVSPFQFLLTGEDNFRLTSWCSFDPATVTIQGRLMDTSGVVKAFAFTHTPRSDRTAKSDDYALSKGALLTTTVFVSSGFTQFGRIFVRLELIRGGVGGAAVVLGTLVQGYITEQERLAWPGSPVQSSLDGAGYMRFRTQSGGGPGQDINVGVDATTRLEFFALSALLTTSAAAGTRRVSLDLYNGSSFVTRCPNPGSQGPSTAQFWCWNQGMPLETGVAPTTGVGPLPLGMPLSYDWHWQTSTSGIGAGDQWSDVVSIVREHLSVAF